MKSSTLAPIRNTALAALMLAAAAHCQSGGEAPPPSTPAESEAGPAADGRSPSEPTAKSDAAPVPAAATTPGGVGPTGSANNAEASDARPGPDAAAGNVAPGDVPKPTAASITCKDGDKIRQVGETWQLDCNTCRCTESGQAACTLKHCE